LKEIPQNFLAGIQRLATAIRYAGAILPNLFVTLIILRSLIRLFYLLASILPFKTLLVLAPDYTLPEILEPYFHSKEALAYSLCLTIALFMIGAKLCEFLVEVIKNKKARVFLGDGYARKIKRRVNLLSIISKATDAASAIIIATLAIAVLMFIHYQTGIAIGASSMLCIGAAVFARGDLEKYIRHSPFRYLQQCVTGAAFMSFIVLVATSLTASPPPDFLSLVACLILLRQYCQSVEQTVTVALSLKEDDEHLERVFGGNI
jgi:hypothetical protein